MMAGFDGKKNPIKVYFSNGKYLNQTSLLLSDNYCRNASGSGERTSVGCVGTLIREYFWQQIKHDIFWVLSCAPDICGDFTQGQ